QFEASRALFLRQDDSAGKAGDILKLPDLGKSYRAMAEGGVNWFYRGPFALATEHWMIQHDGIMSVEDFGKYEVKLREPVTNSYRGYQIIGFPPPSSGGVHVA